MRTIGYRAAIQWMVDNDDTEWADTDEVPIPSVTACLVADIYGVHQDKVTADVQKALAKRGVR